VHKTKLQMIGVLKNKDPVLLTDVEALAVDYLEILARPVVVCWIVLNSSGECSL
jgi:hypothetical protein